MRWYSLPTFSISKSTVMPALMSFSRPASCALKFILLHLRPFQAFDRIVRDVHPAGLGVDAVDHAVQLVDGSGLGNLVVRDVMALAFVGRDRRDRVSIRQALVLQMQTHS